MDIGPCKPGTSVILEGIVWQETEGGVLVVNVTWRGKTYVGTLLDSTKHYWAPPRFCDSPVSDIEAKTSKNSRAKRGRTTNNDANCDTRIVQSKLRNGKGRRTANSGFTVPASPVRSTCEANFGTVTTSGSNNSDIDTNTANQVDERENIKIKIKINHNKKKKDEDKNKTDKMNKSTSSAVTLSANDSKCTKSTTNTSTNTTGTINQDKIKDNNVYNFTSNDKNDTDTTKTNHVINEQPESSTTETETSTIDINAQSPAYSDISDADDSDDHSNVVFNHNNLGGSYMKEGIIWLSGKR